MSPWSLAAFTVASFWLLHLVYRYVEAVVMERSFLLDRAILLAIPLGALISMLLCLTLNHLAQRGLALGLGAAAALSVPTTTLYASTEAASYWLLSPVVNAQPNPNGSGEIEQRAAIAAARESFKENASALILTNSMGWYFFFFGLASFYVGFSNSNRLRSAEDKALRYEALARDTQLQVLRYQINPHFLFNTLNSLSALVMEGSSPKAESMILSLATFYRATLDLDPLDPISVEDEFRLQALYLSIEKVRFDDRLIVVQSLDPNIANAIVPPLILQPLIENAVKHGVAVSGYPVQITIRAFSREAGVLQIDIGNTVNLSAEDKAISRTGVGVANVQARLNTSFGNEAVLEGPIISDGEYRMSLKLPAIFK